MKYLVVGLAKRLAYLWTSRFLRNVVLIAGGTAAAQVITAVYSPIITRIYGPEAFGIVGVFMAILAFIAPLSNFSYSMAIVLPPSDNEARALFKLSLLIGLIVTAISAVIFASFHQKIANVTGFTATSFLLLLAPLHIIFSSMTGPLQYWLIRKRQFYDVSRVTLMHSATINTLKAAAGLIVPSAASLLIVSVIDRVLYTFLLWFSFRPIPSDCQDRMSFGLEKTYLVSLREIAFRYRDFAIYRTPQVWLNSASLSIPPLMLAALFGPGAAGFYAIARTALNLPSSLIAGAVGTVFFPRLVEAVHRCEKLRPLILKGTAGLAIVGLVPFGVVIIFGPWLFGYIFGTAWTMAGEYARWLSLWFYFAFINVPSVQSIPLLDLQSHFLVYEIVTVFFRSASLILGILIFENDLVAIALFSTVGALANICLIGAIAFLSGVRLREGVRTGAEG